MNDYAAIAIFIATLTDVLSTEYALRCGLREANPIARWLMDTFGRVWWGPKFFFAGIVWIFKDDAHLGWIAAVASLLFAVSIHNMILARKVKQ